MQNPSMDAEIERERQRERERETERERERQRERGVTEMCISNKNAQPTIDEPIVFPFFGWFFFFWQCAHPPTKCFFLGDDDHRKEY